MEVSRRETQASPMEDLRSKPQRAGSRMGPPGELGWLFGRVVLGASRLVRVLWAGSNRNHASERLKQGGIFMGLISDRSAGSAGSCLSLLCSGQR